jgi:hypothetical protein
MKTEEVVSKTDKIRAYLRGLKPSERSPTEVSKALAEKGIKASPGFVSVIKAKMKAKAKVKKPKPKPKPKPTKKASRATSDIHESLMTAKVFLEKTGGIDNAKKLLEVVNKLVS